jgi:hypothetical protein
MKLLELVGVKKFADTDLEDVISSMTTHEIVGRGSFAVVLKNTSKPEVVKFWVEDSSYDDFINYVAAHPYKHFPTLYSKPKALTAFFLRTKEFPDKIRYVRMENLKQISEDSIDWEVIRKMFYDLMDCRSKKDVDEFVKFYLSHPGSRYKDEDLEALHRMVKNVPEFCHEMFKMIKVVIAPGRQLDVHSRNIMKRQNGEIVITDPVFSRSDQAKLSKIVNVIYGLLDKNHPEAIKGRKSK